MNAKTLITEICNAINSLNEKTSNLIEIINTIDFQLCNDFDNEVLIYVSTYFNDILYMKQTDCKILNAVRKKLIYII